MKQDDLKQLKKLLSELEQAAHYGDKGWQGEILAELKTLITILQDRL